MNTKITFTNRTAPAHSLTLTINSNHVAQVFNMYEIAYAGDDYAHTTEKIIDSEARDLIAFTVILAVLMISSVMIGMLL